MAYRLLGPRAYPDVQSSLFSLGELPKKKCGEKSSGARSEAQKELATIKATTRPNAPDRGILLGITKKNVINIAQPENRADVCAHESSLLVLLQSNQSRNHWPI
jgi:hypothetical protein